MFETEANGESEMTLGAVIEVDVVTFGVATEVLLEVKSFIVLGSLSALPK